MLYTEDEVRDSSKISLGFNDDEKDVTQGTGQLTTFNKLGFKGISRKPDGWYLPKNTAKTAIVLETKNSDEDITKAKWEKEILDNVTVVETKYKHVIGILYNGMDIAIYKDHIKQTGLSKTLENKAYYLKLYNHDKIDKNQIYLLTKKINDSLHVNFGIKNLYHRMIFTACALVATKEGALLTKGMDYDLFHQSILNTLSKSLVNAKKKNDKLELLIDVYSEIKMNRTDNQDAIDDFIDWVQQISDKVNSDNWNGEDVMGIFFNEFNRYKRKSESGQVFTPDHITSLMYRIIHVTKDDNVLDAACGSGAFLVKAMCNMMKEAGGTNTAKADQIKSGQLFGIEFDREIYALACANMLIHKDGKTNLKQLDSTTQEAGNWIHKAKITKVLMNPPFESKFKCLQIVNNVLNNVPPHTECAFILPDKKLEKDGTSKTYGNKLLEKHRLKKIIKLPEKLFSGVTASIFVFEANVPQNGQEIFGCYIADDGLETVKNQGRQDTKDRWDTLEDYWVDVIEKQSGDESCVWIKPSEHLCYPTPKKEIRIAESDFIQAVVDYEMYKQQIDIKDLKERIVQTELYGKQWND